MGDMDTQPQELTEHLEPLNKLLTASLILAKAVLAFKVTTTLNMSEDVHEQAAEEMYKANEAYFDAYTVAFPKPGKEMPLSIHR